MKQPSHFLMDIDKHRQPFESQRQVLAIIGSGALMLQSDYERGTKDGDVLQTAELSDAVKVRLLQLAGRGTRKYDCAPWNLTREGTLCFARPSRAQQQRGARHDRE